MKKMLALASLAPLLLAPPAAAGPVEIIDAVAARDGAVWRFGVLLKHDDTGWDHYADAWRVVGPDGAVYGTRTLLHPNIGQQPVTRTLEGVKIPENVTRVMIEAHDTMDGWNPSVMEIPLPR